MRERYDVDGQPWIRARRGRWVRALRGGGGGGTTTVKSTTEIPPKSEEELALLRKQTSLLDIQIEQLTRQNSLLAETFPAQKALFEAQTQAATVFAQMQKLQLEALPGQLALQTKLQEEALKALTPTAEEEEITKLSNARTLAILRGEAPALLPGQQEQLDTLYGTAQDEGERDIRQFAEELAASRGMRLSDSPVAGDALRAEKELVTSLQGAKAGAALNLGQASQVFNESVRQFQAGLKQQAYQNRLSLLGRVQGTGSVPYSSQSPVFYTDDVLATYSAINPAVGMMQGERIAGAARTERSRFSTNPGFFDYYKATIGALGAAAGGIAMSSERFKKDITPLDRDEYDRARRRLIRETPVTKWRYKWDPDSRPLRTGPILEMTPEEIREDDSHLNLLNYTGTLHAAVKAIDRDVQELQATLKRSREAVAA